MNSKKLKWILYVIIVVIVSTIGIQVFWNYKNYQTNKQQLINDVQVSLDNAVDGYFEKLAKEQTTSFIMRSNHTCDSLCEHKQFNTFISDLNSSIDTMPSLGFKESLQLFQTKTDDSIFARISHGKSPFSFNTIETDTLWNTLEDSISSKFEQLTSKIVISITNDTLQLKRIDSLLKIELQRKNLNLNYGLSFKDPQFNKHQFFNTVAIDSTALQTTSKSMFLPEPSTLKVYFNNETKIILKRIISGILISILLVLAVISCLIYMLKIIRHQKELAEVKNDLISNITHEFKTPIATISVALEGIKNFNVIDDKVKTKTYLDLSTNQLSKLTLMVEKLLETATLDSDNLDLKKETVDIANILQLIVEKHKMQTKNKEIHFKTSSETVFTKVDNFHFENAINNIIDNAIKYGGDSITMAILEQDNTIDISITDNGNTLTQANVNQIFEKFYRVPKGNTHDIKGFGIGLYYTKKIIEKHDGSITVHLKNDTTFKVIIPKI
jgi:two-component system phosphate regulon sensor histidine kinase PhoR